LAIRFTSNDVTGNIVRKPSFFTGGLDSTYETPQAEACATEYTTARN